MLQLIILGLAAGSGVVINNPLQVRDRVQGTTPVTGMFLIPPKVPDCRTDAQIQQALAEKAAGILPQSCDVPRSVLRQMRR